MSSYKQHLNKIEDEQYLSSFVKNIEAELFFQFITWKENLIKLYFYICEDRGIQRYLSSMRMSNNYKPEFTDQEVMTVYIHGTTAGFSKVKQIYKYTRRYLSDWFPLLPSYQAFCDRLNKLPYCFQILVRSINCTALQGLAFKNEKVIDSVPIIVTGKSRSSSAKVAPQLCNKGYCSSKQMYYYGLKLHVTGIIRPFELPMPEASWITGAGENDLTVARPVFESTSNCKIYADKIYGDTELDARMQATQNSIVLTPVKKEKGQTIVNAADDIYSYLVSTVRQPIESFFNWIIEKTQIQFAQRVRSEKGLLIHVWANMQRHYSYYLTF